MRTTSSWFVVVALATSSCQHDDVAATVDAGPPVTPIADDCTPDCRDQAASVALASRAPLPWSLHDRGAPANAPTGGAPDPTLMTTHPLGVPIPKGDPRFFDPPRFGVPLLDGDAPSATTGVVGCVSCHVVHGSGGDLVRRDGDGHPICGACHAVALHQGGTGSKYGTFGAGFGCDTCHVAHDGTNIALVRSSIDVAGVGSREVAFRAMTGSDSLASDASSPCEVCHTQTSHYRADGSAPDQAHVSVAPFGGPGTRCLSCHPHTTGFAPTCGGCHLPTPENEDYPGGGGAHLAHVQGLGYGCGTCHDGANHNQGGGVYAPANVDVAFAPRSFPGGTTSTNGGTPTHATNSGDATCAVGCHNPIVARPTAEAPNLSMSATWTSGTQACTQCHDTQGAQMRAPSISFHPWDASSATATRRDCTRCHDQSAHTKGTVRVATPSGTIDVQHVDPHELDALCTSCHSGSGTALGDGRTPPDVSSFQTLDFHGPRAGTGWGGSLSSPFARGEPALPCTGCHSQHASTRPYLIGSPVHGNVLDSATISPIGGGADALCTSCHVGDRHAGCVSSGCHASDPMPAPSPCFFCHTHRGIENWPNPNDSSCTHCHGGWMPANLLGDVTPPTFATMPRPTAITSTSVTIGWTTNEATDDVVEWGAPTCCALRESDGLWTTSHAVTLTGLTPGTTYAYRVTSHDRARNPVEAAVAKFSTAP